MIIMQRLIKLSIMLALGASSYLYAADEQGWKLQRIRTAYGALQRTLIVRRDSPYDTVAHNNAPDEGGGQLEFRSSRRRLRPYKQPGPHRSGFGATGLGDEYVIDRCALRGHEIVC